ncbi:thioredoxin family protein [Halioxenophilus sp. WMMB6]|uniref:thioredoxin family protein n=1 Tax=Halioxenophilus sp. WMMB6 TaxID=3073815 RepID=UPI00295E6604|nr:thioredoxin family protein [Halioxenophilus sp. WMMB6]
MREIKVLGSGCTKCVKTAEIITTVANKLGVDAQIIKETSPQAIMSYGVMRTPAVVIDEKLVHSGSIPHEQQVVEWLQ